jgi:HEPN domain-containing protein
MRKEVEQWWKQSKKDLETAQHCISSKDYYACAFFCHQSVEKGLKALYIEKKRASPGATSSLIYLATEVDAPSEFFSFLRQLTPVFVTTRYPDAAYGVPYELYDETIAGEILEESREVIQWIGSQIETSKAG